MKWFGFGNKKTETQVVEVKSSGGVPGYATYLFNNFGDNIGETYLAPQTAYRMYHKIGPLQSTIVKVADAVADLPLVLRSESEPEDITKDAEILDLLNKPSELTTKKQFLADCATSLMLTRELWVVARGFSTGAPEELSFIHPYNVQIIEDVEHQWPAKIYTNVNGDRRYYTREEWGGRYRYFDSTRLNEIFPYIKGRNVSGSSGYFRGISPISSVKDELLGYSASIIGNTSAVENGNRPSGIISPKNDNMSDKQWDDLQNSMEKLQGAGQNGKVFLLPTNVESAFQAWAPKDMDYETLQRNVKMNLWNLYQIPFPMVSDSNQTFNNVETAELSFYDNAVNSVWADVSDALKWAMETRYDLTGYSLSYNQFEVPALRRRAVRMMKEMVDTPLSLDEIRNSGGYDDVPNGDIILVNSGKTTLDSVVEGGSFTEPTGSTNTGGDNDTGGDVE